MPASRIILAEHFGETQQYYNGKVVGWGRAGIPEDDWVRALRVRTRAQQAVAFAGYASYGWAGNRMGASEADRLEHMGIYVGTRLAGTPTAVPPPVALQQAGDDLPGPSPDPELALDEAPAAP